jgi:hypothetical protein
MNRRLQNQEALRQMFSEPLTYDLIIIGGQEAKMTQKTSIMIDLANYLGAYKFLTI